MAFEFLFHIDPEQLRVQDPQSGYHLEMSNRAVVLPKDRLMVALGEPEEAVRARLSSRYGKSARDLRTRTLFGSSGDDLPYEIQAFQYFNRLLSGQLQQARPAALFGARLAGSFDYALEIPGYETFPEARRQALEQNLQARLPIRKLLINGRQVQIPLWKRNLELLLRRLLCQALPILAILAGYLFMPRTFVSSWISFFLFLMLTGYLFYYGGRLLWMLLVRRLVPRDYRMCMLQGAHKRFSQIDQWLAQVAWGVPRSG
jgi:hypothetical protein